MFVLAIIIFVLLVAGFIYLIKRVGDSYSKFVEEYEPSPQEIKDQYWLEFIDWIQDARTIRNLAPPYNVYTDLKSASTPRNVAFIDENNFWLWYAEYKWSKKEADKRRNLRKEKSAL